jgi:hypothetical protein
MAKPKTLADFQHFLASVVAPGVQDVDGYVRFEYQGKFDRSIPETASNWFYLLFGEREAVCVILQSLDDKLSAILTCDEKEQPDWVGKPAAYLSARWSPYKVWMVAEPRWKWERKTLEALDAVAEDFESKDISIVDGREVKSWTKLQPVRRDDGLSRYYPTSDQAAPPNATTRIVPGGWDHEHCELCNEHIDAGHVGYCDPSEHWVCEACYARYVVPHDLAFVDEL